MAGEAVGGAVELRGTHDDEFLETSGQGSGVEDGIHVRGHGLHDLWPVGDGAEEIGHVAAILEEAVVDAAEFGTHLGTIQSADAWHGGSL